jgi:MATE family multidrug resistance protein
VGLPAGALLAFTAGLGPTGLWWGMVAGLSAVAVLLAWRVHAQLQGTLRRVNVESAARVVGAG